MERLKALAKDHIKNSRRPRGRTVSGGDSLSVLGSNSGPSPTPGSDRGRENVSLDVYAGYAQVRFELTSFAVSAMSRSET